MFDPIEKLKQNFTDKYVLVDASTPELRRFEGHVGQVKTVNMSGRALVQFDAWNNIGWYDIDVDFLKIVPKPEAPAEGKHEAKREAAPKAAAGKPTATAGKPATATGEKKLSPIEMARLQGAVKAAGAKPAGEQAVKPAAPAAKAKSSTADILAAARTKKAAETADASVPAASFEKAPVAAPAKPKPASAKPAAAPGQKPNVSEILAWCRQQDTK